MKKANMEKVIYREGKYKDGALLQEEVIPSKTCISKKNNE